MELEENERIDDLKCKGLRIVQNSKGFCFGIDSVLLSEFFKEIKNNSNVVDLGTGTGILGILLIGKTNVKSVIGVEIQEDVCKMAQKSIKLNNLENKFKLINKNVLDIKDELENNYFDAVIMNPPYKKLETGKININEKKLISRHEVKAEFNDFIKLSFKILKDKGSIYFVHRTDRLMEIFSILKENKMEPKKVRFVYSNKESDSKLVLIKAVKNGQSSLKVEKPLIIYNDKNEYTDEILKIYNNEEEK